MERKTRSGKVTTASSAPATTKRKGRKKKSEIDGNEESDQQTTSTTRRSTRGRNTDNSMSETSMAETEDGNSSIAASEVSLSTVTSNVKEEPEDELEVSPFKQVITEIFSQAETEEQDMPIQSNVEIEDLPTSEQFKEEETSIVDEHQPKEETHSPDPVINLEQQLGDIQLTLDQSEEYEPRQFIADEVTDTVEANEDKNQLGLVGEELNVINATPETENSVEQQIKEIITGDNAMEEPASELHSDELMDFEESSKFVRRSRRLQSIYLEPPAPVPAPSESQLAMITSEIKPYLGELILPEVEQQLEEEKSTEMDTNTEEAKPPPVIYKTVEYSDERLKRYETIRDNIYVRKSDKKVCKANKTMKCDCTITEEEVKSGEIGCQYNCINRLLYIECGLKCRCGEYCDNQQFQRYNYSDCSVFDTIVKGFGIRANTDIPSDTFIIEYVGEVLDNKQFEKRAKKYSENKNIHYYFMALKSNAIIDATKKGNISRFINHSCDPNAETQKWTVNGELRVGFFSRKDIKAGQEITFDYQYQRYGKEAQKCYCEAPNCRGWIGENPLDDEEEEDFVEGTEVEDFKAKKTKAKKPRKPKASLDKSEIKDESDSEDDEANNKILIKKREAANKLAALRVKKRQEMFDLEIEGEITDLIDSGLKNRDHTIRLSRLVVRAKNVEARSRLLKILVTGDLPCVRLFLDYNGLKLLHNWMCDINVKTSVTDLEFCLDLIKALEILPITNKTVLRTSKVLDRIEKWKNLDLEKKKMSKEEKKQAKKAEKKKIKEADKAPETAGEDPMKPEDDQKDDDVVKEAETTQPSEDTAREELLLQKKLEVKKAASELLEKWEELKEDFKIPKKQKQEIMIEHEREADDWEDDPMVPMSTDRYKNRFGADSAHTANNRAFAAPKKHFDPNVSKQQRRQMFEMQVAQIDTEKRNWMLHENNCGIFGLSPASTNPLDVPVRVNRVNGEYTTIDGRIAPPPPNHYQFKYEPFKLSTNPDDYRLPPINLPEHWRFALDEFGRIYYYHVKIRQSQWVAPIKILPLKVNNESDEGSPDSDESTTDTEDSEEEELREYLEMLKRKKYLPTILTNSANFIQGGEVDEDDLEKKIMSNMMKNPLDQSLNVSQKRLSKNKRHGLAKVQFIRPRTEADKIYGRGESKRYKEVKEQLRQKKRRILKGEANPDDGSTEDDDDDVALDVSIESRRCVDELDILEKSAFERKKDAEKKAKKLKVPVVDPAEVKRQFRDEILRAIAKGLQPYREDSCENGKITNEADFNSLMNKLAYSVLIKESKHCQINNSILKATESVKQKTKEYIKKYMGKFEGNYQRKVDEMDYANILNKI